MFFQTYPKPTYTTGYKVSHGQEVTVPLRLLVQMDLKWVGDKIVMYDVVSVTGCGTGIGDWRSSSFYKDAKFIGYSSLAGGYAYQANVAKTTGAKSEEFDYVTSACGGTTYFNL
jgi:hypothetical protein